MIFQHLGRLSNLPPKVWNNSVGQSLGWSLRGGLLSPTLPLRPRSRRIPFFSCINFASCMSCRDRRRRCGGSAMGPLPPLSLSLWMRHLIPKFGPTMTTELSFAKGNSTPSSRPCRECTFLRARTTCYVRRVPCDLHAYNMCIQSSWVSMRPVTATWSS